MLGHEPLTDKMTLTLGADFVHEFETSPGDEIPPGTTAVIKLYPPGQRNTLVSIAEWTATEVTESKVTFRAESEEADLIPDRAHFRVYVTYPDTPTLQHCWVLGDVKRKQ